MPTGTILAQAINISRHYTLGARTIPVLDSVSLTLHHGEFLAIMGRSGSGKSTLLHILGCLDLPSSGRYLFDGEEVSQAGDRHLSQIRGRSVGFVFQDFHLLAGQTVYDNVALPFLYNDCGLDQEGMAGRVLAALAQVGLSERLGHRPSELSGGEMQRVAIARALVVQPRVILADEPTGNLDEQSSREVMGILAALHGQGTTIVLVTHDREIAAMAEAIRIMQGGRLL